jgi:hypothetical protein
MLFVNHALDWFWRDCSSVLSCLPLLLCFLSLRIDDNPRNGQRPSLSASACRELRLSLGPAGANVDALAKHVAEADRRKDTGEVNAWFFGGADQTLYVR